MKAVVVLCFFGVAIVAADYTTGHSGRPGCFLEEEFQRPWRNNNDPTRYWVCNIDKRGEPGTEVRCQNSQAFYDPVQACVDWSEWQWTEPYDPPTLADS